jgi:protein phosphatase
MIRVAEHVARTDTGHQRSTNEDSHIARSPVFVIADGMGGAQAGEVASRIAVDHFAGGLPGGESDSAQSRLTRAVQEANAEIHAISERDARRAGMGTTLTAAHVGTRDVTFAHVGDSRAYLWRDGVLERITEDHSLVEELLRQGRLTEEEAEEHPQRSIITRALGPEPEVEVDTFARTAADGDVYLICSDGLTSMIPESAIAEIMLGAADLTTTADRLVAAALEAGGRDNVTVVLFRVEQVAGPPEPEPEPAAAGTAPEPPATAAMAVVTEPEPPGEEDSPALPSDAVGGEPAASDQTAAEDRQAGQSSPEPVRAAGAHRERAAPLRRRAPRMPRAPREVRRRHWRRRLTGLLVALAVVGVLALAAVLATQAVYFIGTDSDGQITVYNGIPYTLPGGVRLYTAYFVSGVTVAELSPLERGRLFNDELRSQRSATNLVSELELDRIAGQ